MPPKGARTPMVWKENRENAYCEITPAILALKEQWEKKNYIDPKLYKAVSYTHLTLPTTPYV